MHEATDCRRAAAVMEDSTRCASTAGLGERGDDAVRMDAPMVDLGGDCGCEGSSEGENGGEGEGDERMDEDGCEEVEDWDDELRECSRYGELAEAKLALEQGASVNAADTHSGNSALHFAAANGHVDIVRWLLGCGAKMDAANRDALNTPLHWAAQNGQIEVVNVLLEAGAPPAAENSFGLTPHDLARDNGHKQVATSLLHFVEQHPQPLQDGNDDDNDDDDDNDPGGRDKHGHVGQKEGGAAD